LFEFPHFAGLVVLPLGAGQLLPQELQLLLYDFEAFFGSAVHKS
jgi:hypothetical protein